MMGFIVDSARAAFMIRAEGGVATLRKYNGRTAAATGDEVPAYSHYPTQEDLDFAATLGIQPSTDHVVMNLWTGDIETQAVKEDRIDVVNWTDSTVTYKVIAVLKRQTFGAVIGSKPLVDRVLVSPIPTDG